MEVFVVIGYNGILKFSGVVGVADSKEKADKIAADSAYMLDKVLITKHTIN
jgi:hypothetical protein